MIINNTIEYFQLTYKGNYLISDVNICERLYNDYDKIDKYLILLKMDNL